ncbi:MAG TPA: CAP domain-containing protein [Solirubrobacteraceae bacterium]|nr:CAP domain-containing protein [Solirubrobacteraceae bacterium]
MAALLVVLLALVFAAPSGAVGPRATGSAAACPGAYTAPTARNGALVDAATLCLMNQLRTARGMPPLRLNNALAHIASGQASDMVRGHYFGDQSISGQSPLARVMASGYVAHPSAVRLLTAQNIGWGTGPNATPAGIVRAWMHSPPHRHIMLTPAYRDAGVGASPSVPSGLGSRWLGGTYAVEFGTRGR